MTVWQFWHGFMAMHILPRDHPVNTRAPGTEQTAEIRTNCTRTHPFVLNQEPWYLDSQKCYACSGHTFVCNGKR